MQFVLISDGEPNNPELTLETARTYANKINTIYVGPEERPIGRDFLSKLAIVSGGQMLTAGKAIGLADQTIKLLAA
jgi:hypothetical protein